MPRRTLRPCAQPGCPVLSYGRCDAHQLQVEPKPRPSPAERGYGEGWRRNAKRFLKAHPECTDCGALATHADHSPITRAELVERGEAHPDAWRHLQPRCGPCHSRKTAANDGGFGNPRRPADVGVTPPSYSQGIGTGDWSINLDGILEAPDGWRCPVGDEDLTDATEGELIAWARRHGWMG